MATASEPLETITASEQARADWLSRLADLIDRIEQVALANGWATRRTAQVMADSVLGDYQVPALRLQSGVVQILLEPIGRSALGVDGVVDLYRMPAYDDVATLLAHQGQWFLYQPWDQESGDQDLKTAAQPLTAELISDVLARLARDAE